MPSELAFLRAIIEEPDEDAHRLVYADWLDETGDRANADRAEFIRVQCRLARLADGSPERPKLVKREQALLKKYAHPWAEPFKEVILWWTYRRGFLDSAAVRTEGMGKKFAPLFKGLVAGTPLRGLVLFEQFAQPRVLLSVAEDMARLREFLVLHGHLQSEGRHLRALFQSPHLGGLTCLEMECDRNGSWFRPRTLCAILKSTVLARLESLSLGDYLRDLDPAVTRAVARSPSLANLKRLSLVGTSLDAPTMTGLTRAAYAPQLEVLELRHCSFNRTAWQVLLAGKTFPRLKRLLLAGAVIDRVALNELNQGRRLRDEAEMRYGPETADFAQGFPVRPRYHSWWGD